MTAAVAQKFTFDLDLGKSSRKIRSIPEDQVEQMLIAARQSAYDQGYAEGKASVEARSADRLAKAADTLAAQAVAAVQALDEKQKQNLTEAIDLAASVARKLAAHLIARQPQTELIELIKECMSSLDRAPHLVVRCHPGLCDAMQSAAEKRMASSGFNGRLVVMGDPDISLGDGRLEWVDGGLVRDINAISQDINTRIAAYLAAHGVSRA